MRLKESVKESFWTHTKLCFFSPEPDASLDHVYRATASCGVPVYFSAFAGGWYSLCLPTEDWPG